MKRLRFHRMADQEFLEAILFYADQRPGLGERWQAEAESVLHKIRTQPNAGRPAGRAVKQCVLPSFPYAVIFLDRTTEIFVVAIAHQSRRPGYWTDRVELGAS